MTRQETLIVLGILRTSFPRFYVGMKKQDADNMVNLWCTMFAEDCLEHVKLAVYKLISTCEFPPTIAEMRKALSFIRDAEIPIDGEAWGEVIAAIRRFGYTREEAALGSMTEITKRTVKAIGWANLCQSENSIADRAHFLKIYSCIAERKKVERLLPVNILEQIADSKERLAIESVGDIVKKLEITEGGKTEDTQKNDIDDKG